MFSLRSALLRHAFPAFDQSPVNKAGGPEPFADQAQGEVTFYLAVEQLQQDAVVHLGKKVPEVYALNMLVTFIDVLMRLLQGLVGVAVGTEAVAVLFELKLKERCHQLADGLLQQPAVPLPAYRPHLPNLCWPVRACMPGACCPGGVFSLSSLLLLYL